jgi:hypothetical protein
MNQYYDEIISSNNICLESRDRGIDKMYILINNMMCERKFDEIDQLLTLFEIDTICIEMMLGLIVATNPIRNRLKNRPKFIELTKARVIRDEGSIEEGLFSGLEI